MAAFPRTVPPASVTYPKVIGSLISVGQSGALQTRSEAAQGRTWQETWSALPAGNEDVQELLTTIENLYNTGATCTLTHYLLPGSGKAANGAGGGTPLVNGADQSGTSLITDGWTAAAANRMKTGDCFTVAGLSVLFRVTGDAASDGSGDATLAITPPIVAGSSPANNAALTIASANLTAVIVDYSGASAGPAEYIGGLTVTFREAP
jgi:hypothetical protein